MVNFEPTSSRIMRGSQHPEHLAASPMLRPTIEFLKACPPFAALPATQLEFLAKRLQPRFYGRGERIGRQAGLCIVKSGRIALYEGDTRECELGPGALFTPERGRATAVADSLCLELDTDGTDSLEALLPGFRQRAADA
jgi:signal-transduction protein with cAMP-binding, CBS, and nucleotidyltransferase domain